MLRPVAGPAQCTPRAGRICRAIRACTTASHLERSRGDASQPYGTRVLRSGFRGATARLRQSSHSLSSIHGVHSDPEWAGRVRLCPQAAQAATCHTTARSSPGQSSASHHNLGLLPPATPPSLPPPHHHEHATTAHIPPTWCTLRRQPLPCCTGSIGARRTAAPLQLPSSPAPSSPAAGGPADAHAMRLVARRGTGLRAPASCRRSATHAPAHLPHSRRAPLPLCWLQAALAPACWAGGCAAAATRAAARSRPVRCCINALPATPRPRHSSGI